MPFPRPQRGDAKDVFEDHHQPDDYNHRGNYPQIYSAPTVDTLDTLQNTSMASATPLPQIKMVKTNKKVHRSDKEFQIPEDSMHVTVRKVPISQRSVFSRKHPPLPQEIAHLSRKRISPSMQQLALIHKVQNMTHCSQLNFGPSVGRAADSLAPLSLFEASKKRDGRYRSIDPIQATVQALPPNPPLLSNRKHRLPLRSDVGFPGASLEEIQQKQKEIANETEWEEASPRLIVLVTSDDIGIVTTIQDEGSLGGPELLYQKECNRKHFHQLPAEHDNGSTTTIHLDRQYRTSSLAPPLDATFSRSMGWRPRAFHDRQPEMFYSLVCPLSIDFAVGNIEPLVCSLTLYSLHDDNENELPSGKTSEEFWFPAGDWKGRVAIDSLLPTEGGKGGPSPEAIAKWLKRKYKAIFAHDPYLVDTKDIFVVLQIYKVLHVDLAAAYLQSKSNGSEFDLNTFQTDKQGYKRNIQKYGKKDEATKAAFRANSAMESFGTQFLSPLSFGVTPLFPVTGKFENQEDDYLWPQGHVAKDVQLFAYPPMPESQEEFVSRLKQLALRHEGVLQEQQLLLSNEASFGDDNFFNPSFSFGSFENSADEATTSSSTKKKKTGVSRLFKSSSKKQDVATKISVSDQNTEVTSTSASLFNNDIVETQKIAGTATFFSSAFDVDFLQAMLYTPPELDTSTGDSTLPSVLVDASGEAAVMLDPKSTTNIVRGNVRKRSDLIRLPCRDGYLDACDFREILFLPPRIPKSYSLDIPPSFRSLFNFLFLYPRLLRQDSSASSSKKTNRQRYSLRIRLIQVTSEEVGGKRQTKNVTFTSFYNPAPWAGPSMLKSVFTRVPGDDVKHDLQRVGIPMRDEFKLRLPMLIDGSFFLHFTLFAVDLDDELANGDDSSGISTHPVSETTIPLASYSPADPKTGARAMVIIPNGNHRLKLGDFQLQVETRLYSSVHLSDPAVAATLRDFPFVNDDGGQNQEAMINRVKSESSSNDTHDRLSYSGLLTSASGNALAGQFQLLLLMHMSNLINLRNNKTIESDERILMERVLSLLHVCKQIKNSFSSTSESSIREERFRMFIKTAIDMFDENTLKSTDGMIEEEEDSGHEEDRFGRSNRFNQSVGNSVTLQDVEEEDQFDGGAVRRRKKDPLGDMEIRLTRTFSIQKNSEHTFSRVAYGASKTDRMRLEAELDSRTHYVDDDETVVTVETRLTEAREIFERSKSKLGGPKSSGGDSIAADSSDGRDEVANGLHGFSAYARSLGGLGIAQRAKNAAQIIIAPCVAAVPAGLQSNVASLFTDRINPHVANGGDSQAGIESNPSAMKLESGIDENGMVVDRVLYSPGSDIEEEDAAELGDTLSHSGSAYYTSEGTFRSPFNCQVLRFSISGERNSDNRYLPIGRGDYIYESLLVLWLRAWMSQSGDMSTLDIGATSKGKHAQMFFDHLDVLIPIVLKSIVLRYSKAVEAPQSRISRVIVDQGHMNVLASFVEMLALFVMNQAAEGLETTGDASAGLEGALVNVDFVVDFFVGLCAVFHPAQIDILLNKLFDVLRQCDGKKRGSEQTQGGLDWSDDTLRRSKCSRKLRLRIIERLAVLPNFVALNYPRRVMSEKIAGRKTKESWTKQHSDSTANEPAPSGDLLNSGDDLLPKSGWLAELLTTEALSICSQACQAVVEEAMAHIETQSAKKNGRRPADAPKQKPNAPLSRDDLLMFQSIAIHAITVVYELLLRRHAMDIRFQRDSSRGRIAALFAKPVFDASLSSIRWLARLESTHKVRSLWLLCFVYLLQEVPENLLRQAVRSYSNPKNIRIHRFIRLLRLGSSSFQSFFDQERHGTLPSEIDKAISPWLLQESFNTMCATTIVVVEECASPLSMYPSEQKAIVQGILDLLLHVLTTPQSAVTHLRAIGGAIQALESFGVDIFLEVTGDSLQHWLRVVLGLMNSVALSVRSIAVDFVVSLMGSTFDAMGNIHELALTFATVLPEVAAREIALHSVSGHVETIEHIEKSLWPLRRSFADIEDANPLDDDRVDPQLAPILSEFCRTCQALLDGVLIEVRLQGSAFNIVGTQIREQPVESYIFDADEESIFEAASFFVPETAPIQRVRWLLTLKSLHKAKGQWVEAAECLVICAKTICDSIPHLRHVWRPSRFALWSDERRSLWLSTVGQDIDNPEKGNAQVMNFAGRFLEPDFFNFANKNESDSLRLPQPTVSDMCTLLTVITKESVSFYLKEEGMDSLAYSRLESLVKVLMSILDDHGIVDLGGTRTRLGKNILRKQQVEEEAALRKVIASISLDMTKLAERLLLIAEDEPNDDSPTKQTSDQSSTKERHAYFVRVLLSGKKPTRFLESTTLPTFLEWQTPCICRVPKGIADAVLNYTPKNVEDRLCEAFGSSLRNALLKSGSNVTIVTGSKPQVTEPKNGVILDIGIVKMNTAFSAGDDGSDFAQQGKHFLYHKSSSANGGKGSTVKMTVAHPFPCPLSRQRTILTSELMTSKPFQ
ncbi:unnamed protein product [Cylindrotheca closterium]|uniref:DOCKER Lobe A domain-containing protein n=1 Tax=Cylindrotheca closterium TaxID=2856 RepID=A0AAD2CM00_9STRA|nr:unnamed protein product [Cylindrotheca closterium]